MIILETLLSEHHTLFALAVREIEHAEKVIIDTLLLKGVGSPP